MRSAPRRDAGASRDSLRSAPVAAAILACVVVASARVLAAEPAALSPQQEHGRKVYNGLCVFCHAPGLWGTTTLAKRMDKQHAVLDGRTDLAPATIRVAVRVGIGSMPPLRKTEVTDSDLDAVIAYLTRAATEAQRRPPLGIPSLAARSESREAPAARHGGDSR